MTTPTIDSTLSGQTTGTIKIPDYYTLLSSIADSLSIIATKSPDTAVGVGVITGPVFESLTEIIGVAPGYFLIGDGIPPGTVVISVDSLLTWTYTTNNWIPPITLTGLVVDTNGNYTYDGVSPLNPLLGSTITITGTPPGETDPGAIVGFSNGKSYIVTAVTSNTFTLEEVSGLGSNPIQTIAGPVSMTYTPDFLTRTILFVSANVYTASQIGPIKNAIVDTGVKAFDPYSLIGRAGEYAYYHSSTDLPTDHEKQLEWIRNNLPGGLLPVVEQIKTLLKLSASKI